jgi:predicted RNase H-like HicB family nuclease
MAATPTVRVTGRVYKDEDVFVAECHELGIFTCARTLEELFPSIQDLVLGHFEAWEKLGRLQDELSRLRVDAPPPHVRDLSIKAVFKIDVRDVIGGKAEAEYSFQLAS